MDVAAAEVTGRKPQSGAKADKKAAPTRDPPPRPLTYSIVQAGKLIGLSRNASYAAAKSGDIPTVRIGRLLLVPKKPFLAMFGIREESEIAAQAGVRQTSETV